MKNAPYSNSVILVDCDGVLLNWEFSFHVWMERKGFVRKNRFAYHMRDQYPDIEDPSKYVQMFNESAVMGFLPPHRDAIYYVKDMLHKKHGYVFDVISSFTSDPYAGELRIRNLKKLFGETTFRNFTFLDVGADKDEALAKYKDTEMFFVEDKLENAKVALRLGLRPVLMEHAYNMHYEGTDFPVITSWQEFYHDLIL